AFATVPEVGAAAGRIGVVTTKQLGRDPAGQDRDCAATGRRPRNGSRRRVNPVIVHRLISGVASPLVPAVPHDAGQGGTQAVATPICGQQRPPTARTQAAPATPSRCAHWASDAQAPHVPLPPQKLAPAVVTKQAHIAPLG
ncbi:MAG TPA: hypothetical protein VFX03_09445, partial [Thermomicrobiales bacterium]|nr:hypothetical protein [Thermomicrobiales bacterium]